MGPAAGGKRGRGGNVTAELLERNSVDKVSQMGLKLLPKTGHRLTLSLCESAG